MVLDQQQAAEFEARLRDRARQLRDEIRATLERSNDETHLEIAGRMRDAGDESFSALIVDLNLFDINRDADELRRIEAAMLRLKQGRFGECIDCGQEIPLERLEAEPTAARCVKCQELHEKTYVSPVTPTL